LSGGLVLFGAAIGTQSYVYWKRGIEKPTKELEVAKPPAPKESSAELLNDPELVSLRKAMEARPGDVVAMKALAGALGVKLRNNPEPPPELVFEAIDLLGTILQGSPDDPDALVMMADLSFDQKAFTKALDFYERYLKVRADDLGARSRYASTMTFMGRYDDSIRELDTVLRADPKNFPAMAYLAITWAQKGDFDKARKVGVTALEIAPSDEARARFSGFISGLDEAEQAASGKAVAASSAPAASDPGAAAGGVDQLVSFIKVNPIAGPKFASHEFSGETLTLYFKDFPMQGMPPFAKEKFFGGIRTKAAEVAKGAVKTIVFADAATKAEMERLAL
jgi:tetratricopeptide (TPR) repeat protein